jgi:hypothetical protein
MMSWWKGEGGFGGLAVMKSKRRASIMSNIARL